MASEREGARGQSDQPGHETGEKPASENERRLLRHGRSTLIGALGPSLTTKSGGLFALSDEDGDIDSRISGGHGLYFHDTRYLNRATLRLNGRRLSVLLSTAEQGDRSVCELTNPDLSLPSGETVPKETLGLRREWNLGGTREEIKLHSFHAHPIDVTLEMEFAADFESMFVVRGAAEGKRGTLHPPSWDGDTLVLRYDGADGHMRRTSLTFDPPPSEREGGSAHYRLHLEPRRDWSLRIGIGVSDESGGDGLAPTPEAGRGKGLRFRTPQVETDNELFDRVLTRSFEDLRMLAIRQGEDSFFAAGVPWYVALFGRDSIITALQTLAFDAGIAAHTLRLLAKYQGTKQDGWKDEEPGKILHELRVDEKANLHEVPQTPYYGTVDATPLFVVLLAEYVRWTGDFGLWRALRGNVERALEWIDRYGDHDGDGFTDYVSSSAKGLSNQGWKDSGNSITNRDGSLAVPPVALVEVQGYVYRAKHDAAWLYEHDGDGGRASSLRQEAEDLRRRFHDAFWMDDRNYLAVALAKDGKRAESITSNPGQALWSGIVARDRVEAVAATLLDQRMFSGWGIRTMAEGEAAYNPIDYQVGSVWPHDNSIIAAGLKQYGRDEESLRVFGGLFQAAAAFQHYRLPEVFAGFSRSRYEVPVRYPVACSPQAWAAGSIPCLLATALGLQPAAHEQRLEVVRPALPNWLNVVTVRGLRVGKAEVDLRYHRQDGATLVAVIGRKGDLEVRIRY